jgi:hypothetical protein
MLGEGFKLKPPDVGNLGTLEYEYAWVVNQNEFSFVALGVG